MADLGAVAWPPGPLTTERLTLRHTEARDRSAYIELLASPDVRAFLGGPHPREEFERAVPGVPGEYVGVFAVELAGAMIGTVVVNRRDADRPGHVGPGRSEIELSYTFLPHVWGCGYATEAAVSVLDWVGRVAPEEPVVLCTQSANAASVRVAQKLGFVEVERFQEFGAEQWFGVRRPV